MDVDMNDGLGEMINQIQMITKSVDPVESTVCKLTELARVWRLNSNMTRERMYVVFSHAFVKETTVTDTYRALSWILDALWFADEHIFGENNLDPINESDIVDCPRRLQQ